MLRKMNMFFIFLVKEYGFGSPQIWVRKMVNLKIGGKMGMAWEMSFKCFYTNFEFG